MPQTRDWTASSFFFESLTCSASNFQAESCDLQNFARICDIDCFASTWLGPSLMALQQLVFSHSWRLPSCLNGKRHSRHPGMMHQCVRISWTTKLPGCTMQSEMRHIRQSWRSQPTEVVLSRGVSCNGRLQRWWCLLQNEHDFQVMYQDTHCRLITPLNEERFNM